MKKTIGLILLVLAFIGYQEYRMSRLEHIVEDIQDEVHDMKVEQEIRSEVVHSGDRMKVSDREFECLAHNIFYEAGVEDEIGKIAVGHVTLNRVQTGRWGDSICDVVYAKAQFSWTLKKRKSKTKGPLWEESVQMAKLVINGARISTLHDSLYYHTDYIATPYWVDESKKLVQIGQHLFYSTARVVLRRA